VRRESRILRTYLGSEKDSDSDPVRDPELVTVTAVVTVQELGIIYCEESLLGEDQLALGFVRAKGLLAGVISPLTKVVLAEKATPSDGRLRGDDGEKGGVVPELIAEQARAINWRVEVDL
jgi:hypothetical protein